MSDEIEDDPARLLESALEGEPGEEIQSEKSEKRFDPMMGKATQFKPGQSGNPNGRPKTGLITAALRRRAAMRYPGTVPGIKEPTYADLAAYAIYVAVGKQKSSGWARELLERLEGKVPLPIMEKLELTGDDGGPLRFTLAVGAVGGNGAARLPEGNGNGSDKGED